MVYYKQQAVDRVRSAYNQAKEFASRGDLSSADADSLLMEAVESMSSIQEELAAALDHLTGARPD